MREVQVERGRMFRPGQRADIGKLMREMQERLVRTREMQERLVRTRCRIKEGELTEVELDGTDLGEDGVAVTIKVTLGDRSMESGWLEYERLETGFLSMTVIENGIAEMANAQPGRYRLTPRTGTVVTGLPCHKAEIRVEHGHPTVIADPLHHVQGLQIVGAGTVPLPRIRTETPKVHQGGGDAAFIPEDFLQLQNFLVIRLRLLPASAHGTDVPQVPQGRCERTPVPAGPVALQSLHVALVGLRIEAPGEVLVPLAVQAF